MQSTANIKLFACLWPDYYGTMNACDRELYQWIEQIPWNGRPGYLNNELSRIAYATYLQQYQQWASCEASRYASQPAPETGLHLALSSKLAGNGISRQASASTPSGKAARLSVAFAPGAGTPPTPPPCTPGSDPSTWTKIPYYMLHKLDKVGINYFPYNTLVEFPTNSQGSYWNGTGPWEGSKVFIVWSLNNLTMWNFQNFFNMTARVHSPKVFDHWVSFKTISNPTPPANLLLRCEPFDLASLQVQTSVPYNWNAPEGQRGQGWQIYIEYTHVESGQSWVVERWLETSEGWNPVSLGGYGADQTFWDSMPADVGASTEADGTWYHRVCVYDFKRLPTPISVLYNNVLLDSGTSAITPLVTIGYVPGAAGIASCDETVTVHTVGATKASFRIVGIQPVPGVGVLITIKVVNELHFAACIVTPFLSGLSNRQDWYTNVLDFNCPTIWVVRNLQAHSESAPISILMPVSIIHPGNYDLLDRHWRNTIAVEGYPAPTGQFQDGLYGGWRSDPNWNIGSWPPPGYKISTSPEQYAFLLAGYREDGTKIWHSPWDSTADLNRFLMRLPLQNAPGTEVQIVGDPRFNVTYPTYFDQMPFLCFVEWSGEVKVSNNPEVWEYRTGRESIGLDLPSALTKYGRYLTLSVAEGRPMWSPYYGKWVTVFNSWPGGNENELETYLVDQYLLPRFRADWGWRNFQYTSLKKPYLTTGIMSWFDTQPFEDRPGYLQALTLIKESSSTTTFDVALVGYW